MVSFQIPRALSLSFSLVGCGSNGAADHAETGGEHSNTEASVGPGGTDGASESEVGTASSSAESAGTSSSEGEESGSSESSGGIDPGGCVDDGEGGSGRQLCVNPRTGDDSLSYADVDGSAQDGTGSCWATIGRAAWGSTDRNAPNGAEAAQAGDTVWIAAGTYVTTGTDYRFGPAYNPANEGTLDEPIRFVGVGEVVLEYSAGTGPMIGSEGRDHIQWSGFIVSEETAPTTSDTGPVTFLGCVGGSIENSVLTGDPNWAERVGDNYCGVRLEDASGVRIYRNRIVGFGGQTGDENHNGVETYRSYPVTIENNEIENCGSGIYMKAVNTDTFAVDTVLIRYNVFVDNPTGVRVLRMPMTEETPMLIYQNVFRGNGSGGLWVNVFDNGQTDPRWIRVFNNTFHDEDEAGIATFNHEVFQPDSNLLFWNNIVYGGTHSIRIDTPDVTTNVTKDRHDFEHNLYYGYATAFASLGGNDVSFSAWQDTHGQDATAIEADPMFVDGEALDFRLSPGSPAIDHGRAVHGVGGADGTPIPAGAYITGNEAIGLAACGR